MLDTCDGATSVQANGGESAIESTSSAVTESRGKDRGIQGITICRFWLTLTGVQPGGTSLSELTVKHKS
jgi:hypothetical protein